MKFGPEVGTRMQKRKRAAEKVSNWSVDVFRPNQAELSQMAEGVSASLRSHAVSIDVIKS